MNHEISVRYIVKESNYGIVRISGLNNQNVNIRIQVYDDSHQESDKSKNSFDIEAINFWGLIIFLYIPIISIIIRIAFGIMLLIIKKKCKKKKLISIIKNE